MSERKGWEPIVSDEEQFLDELDDLIFRGMVEFLSEDHLQITQKGLAMLAEARRKG